MELDQLYTDFKGVLFSYIKSKVSNLHDAEDILHDTFIKIAANLDSVNRSEKLRSWIFTVTRNNIMDYYRKKNGGSVNIALTDEVSGEPPEEEYNDITKGLDCCLMNFLNQLPAEYRSILIDVELNGAKQKDLVDKYELAYPSIRSRVQRGREKLKQILLNCCNVEWDNRGNVLEVQKKNGCEPSPSKSCNQ
jgi:RNA polymerase sigma-70 factor, ECF subfamily